MHGCVRTAMYPKNFCGKQRDFFAWLGVPTIYMHPTYQQQQQPQPQPQETFKADRGAYGALQRGHRQMQLLGAGDVVVEPSSNL